MENNDVITASAAMYEVWEPTMCLRFNKGKLEQMWWSRPTGNKKWELVPDVTSQSNSDVSNTTGS